LPLNFHHDVYILISEILNAFVLSSIQAYDQHLNMILGDVEEVVATVEIDDETYEEIVHVSIFDFLFS
jgi:hypothetical protein